jgi:hypothetical protein
MRNTVYQEKAHRFMQWKVSFEAKMNLLANDDVILINVRLNRYLILRMRNNRQEKERRKKQNFMGGNKKH